MKIEVDLNIEDVIDQMGWIEFCQEANLELWLRGERWKFLKVRIGIRVNGNIDQMFNVNLLEIVEEEIESIELDKLDQERAGDYLESMKIIRDQIIKIEKLPKQGIGATP